MLKVIKSEAEYTQALATIEELMLADPEAGTAEAEQLELMALLIEDYEARTVNKNLPDPIEAILFRMEQQGLTPRDLIPYLGSRSKVSEILARKRPLSLTMIRALHEHLGIPAKSLLQDYDVATQAQDIFTDWEKYPVKEMVKRGWLQPFLASARDNLYEAVRLFFATLGPSTDLAALYRRSIPVRASRSIDPFALKAWTARIVIRAQEEPPASKYVPGTVDAAFMRHAAQLSWSDQGPVLVREFLNKNGISLIIEPHLPQTRLDGAAILYKADWPIIGLTIRHDRLDNFWFCLMHELAHVSLHLKEESAFFFDDLDMEVDDEQEREADEMAGEELVPHEEWIRSAASRAKTPQAAELLAKKLNIHPAIVAGKMRHESKSYRILNQLVGHKEVRNKFPEIAWSD